jgi:hypothetical protein
VPDIDTLAAGQPSIEEATRLMRAGLAAAMRDVAARYAIPIWWVTPRNRQPLILDSGSCFLLDCGEGPFLTTAGHVDQGFRQAKEEHWDALCFVGDVRFDPIGRRIAYDPVYDVATFDVTRAEVDSLAKYANGKLILTGSQVSWPPEPPMVDRGVFFVGFPGDGRQMRPYRGGSLVEVDWSGYTAIAVATGVSHTDITLVFDHQHDFDVGLRPSAPTDWALGGCSGAPLLTFVEQRGIFSWRLGGIIYEATRLILKASRADCLNSDGTINAYPDPMAYLKLSKTQP